MINGNDRRRYDTPSMAEKIWTTQGNQATRAFFYHVAADNDFLYRPLWLPSQ